MSNDFYNFFMTNKLNAFEILCSDWQVTSINAGTCNLWSSGSPFSGHPISRSFVLMVLIVLIFDPIQVFTMITSWWLRFHLWPGNLLKSMKHWTINGVVTLICSLTYFFNIALPSSDRLITIYSFVSDSYKRVRERRLQTFHFNTE